MDRPNVCDKRPDYKRLIATASFGRTAAPRAAPRASIPDRMTTPAARIGPAWHDLRGMIGFGNGERRNGRRSLDGKRDRAGGAAPRPRTLQRALQWPPGAAAARDGHGPPERAVSRPPGPRRRDHCAVL